MWMSSKGDIGYTLSSHLVISSRSNCPVQETTRNCWKSKPGWMLLPGATTTADEIHRDFVLSILSEANENTCCPSILCTTFLPTDSYSCTCTLTSSFAVEDVSHRGASIKRRTWYDRCIYFWNNQSISFNSWDTEILVLFACGVCEFIKVLRGNIVLRHNRGWHCPQRLLVFHHLSSMSKQPDVLSDLISFCSITRLQLRPTENWCVLRMIYNTF